MESKRNEDRNVLQRQIKELESTPFPTSPDSDNLADWIMGLLEIDGYYVGHAKSIAAEVPVDFRPDILPKLRIDLEGISIEGAGDRDILKNCFDYLEMLERVVATMTRMRRRKFD